MEVLNIIDWIAVIFFGGSAIVVALTAIFIYAVIAGKNEQQLLINYLLRLARIVPPVAQAPDPKLDKALK